MSNRKRTSGRKVQTIKCAETIVVKGKKVNNPEAGRLKQIKHMPLPARPTTVTHNPSRTGKTTVFEMSVTYAGEGELQGIIEAPEVIVHAGNRANLIRRAQRVLREKHGVRNPAISIPAPSNRIEGIVL
jgi:hypothetical protein